MRFVAILMAVSLVAFVLYMAIDLGERAVESAEPAELVIPTTTTTSTTAPPTTTTTVAPTTTTTARARTAPIAPPTGDVWDRLASCESGGRWDIHDSIHQGGLQFAVGTWDAYRPADFPSDAHLATREQQIAVAERVQASQGWQAWPTCSRRIGLR